MSVGIVELALLVVLGMTAGIAHITKRRLWVVPLFGFFVVAAIFSPADVVSTIGIGIGAFIVHRLATRPKPPWSAA